MARKTLALLALVAIALFSFVGMADAGKPVDGAKVTPNVVDDGSGGGGGAYPSQTGNCQIDGQFDGDPNTWGPGGMATFGTRQLRCMNEGTFFYDINEPSFYLD
jgi:hypothetical protein